MPYITDQTPHIEVIQGPTASANYGHHRPWYRSRRLFTFVPVFLLCAVVGLIYTFSRPALYRASSTLLTAAEPAVDQPRAEADIQHVAIQSQRLLGQPLLQSTLERLDEKIPGGITDVPELRRMLSVVPTPETNIVELRAEGPDPEILHLAVNDWVDVYLEQRALEVEKARGTTSDALREQYEALGSKLEAKRSELDRFRQEHDILTMARDENQVLAKLKGLNAAISKANEEEVKARAKLDAVRSAIAVGKPVVPADEQRSLAALETRAQDLREQLTELERRYTREFIRLDPNLKVIPQQLKELEAEIKKKLSEGKKVVVTETEREAIAAGQSVQELQTQLDALKRQATEFTARFAEHEALKEDIVALEELYRTTEGRLVQIQTEDRRRFPPVNVLERAHRPDRPVWPDYWRDAGIALAISLAAALFAVWIVEYLSRRGDQETPASIAGVRVYADQTRSAITPPQAAAVLPDQQRPALQQPLDAELDPVEIRQLFEGADTSGRLLIALLLSGLKLEEISRLKRDDFDFNTGELHVPDPDARTLRLASVAAEAFAGSDRLPAEAGGNRDSIAPDELAARITLLAVDAGLPEPQRVTAGALRHSYLAFLVRQGAKLSELERIVGTMPPTSLAAYARLSPPGPGLPIDQIDLSYPLFPT